MTRRMAVAMISDHASPLTNIGDVDSGGQNVYVGQLARHLGAAGYAVDVFTRRDNATLPDSVPLGERARVIHVPAGPPKFVRKEELLPYMDEFTDHLLRFCRDRCYDIIHANFFMSGLVAANVAPVIDVPFVITFHALGRVRRLYQKEADRFPEARFAIEDRLVREAAGIVAECPQDRDDLVDLYSADPAKITVIPCGFDPGEFSPVDRPLAKKILGFHPDARVILQLGRLVPRKGIDTAIQGVARLLKDYGISAELVIVGGATRAPDPAATPEIGRLKAVASEAGIVGNVLFRGQAFREELKFYYSAADVFVTTPWYEPFGITPLESMACGTPVVGSRVGGIKFSVKDGETGYLVPAKDEHALANRLAYLLAVPRLRAYCGARAVERVNALFTWATVAEKIAALYEAVHERAAVEGPVFGTVPAEM